MYVKKPLKIGQSVPKYARDPLYPKWMKEKDWKVTGIDWNYNGTYYAVYLHGAGVIATCSGRSMKSICATAKQYSDCRKVVADINRRTEFDQWRNKYHQYHPVWDLNNLYQRFLDKTS
jgi:hypothetical protein